MDIDPRAVCIGIDPGVTGGLAILDAQTGELLEGMRTPILPVPGKKEYDIGGMKDALAHNGWTVRLATIEKVGARPGDGIVGAFSFGCGTGLWLGLMSALAIPYIEVTPQRWQSKMLAGLPRGPKSKASAMRAAKSLFPHIPVRVKADNGIADAALIAEYGRRLHIGDK
jgi:crossover junction endodeoxyribonuclease RuvC